MFTAHLRLKQSKKRSWQMPGSFWYLNRLVVLETVLLVELVDSTICLGKLLLTSVEWV